jgi:glycosyltransferase involved in cell wall biosynthesis
MSNLKVSIVTITQLKRFDCLQILCDIVNTQTYKNIVEWVVVDGSKTKEDGSINENNIKTLQSTIPIVYVPWKPNTKLGELRNIGNRTCKGDITVCMDDDDYYTLDRVEHAVKKLSSSSANIAGCSAILIYDYFLDKLYKFNQFGPNHSTNNCMAWKKEYLIKNSHDSSKEMAEESSFTNNFTEPMVQLEAEHTIVCSSHDGNTFNKRELLVGGTHKINPTLNEVECNITSYIKEPYYTRFRNIFYKEGVSEYDIVYFTGGFTIKWDPRDMSLTGSEQAIVNLVNHWGKTKKVAVYGEVPEIKFNNVDYISWKKFPFENKHNIIILWRLYGLWSGAPYPLKANQIWLDCHDNFAAQFPESWKKYGKVVNKLFFKSKYHLDEFENRCEKLKPNRYVIIPNGVRTEQFLINKDNVVKNPFRFIDCSAYVRGLVEILKYIWPVIYQLEPRSELHVYYGMDEIKDDNAKNMFKMLLSQPGVMDHGRQPMEIIIRAKHMSSFHLYITNTPIEIDCISIRESLATGTIPLITNFGVFKEREGVHFDLPLQTRDVDLQQIGAKIVQLMKQGDKLNPYRETIKKSPLLVSWEKISSMWLNLV